MGERLRQGEKGKGREMERETKKARERECKIIFTKTGLNLTFNVSWS